MMRQPNGATGVSAEEGEANRVSDRGSPHFRYRFVSSFQAMGRKPIQILPRLSGASREEGRTFSPLPATPKMIPATATTEHPTHPPKEGAKKKKTPPPPPPPAPRHTHPPPPPPAPQQEGRQGD